MSLNFGKMDFAVSFSPMTAFPLDARSYFESLAAAQAAAAQAVEAGSAEGTVYFGQTVTVVENGVAQMFQVQPDGTLGEIGGKIEIDEKQFVIDEETGKLNLYGFANAVAGAQLVVEEVEVEGEKVKQLKWVKPDTTTVDGLATAVADLESAQEALADKVGDLETAVGKAAEGETAATGLFADIAEIEGRVGSTEDEIVLLEEGLGDLEELVGVPAGEGVEASGVFAQIDGLDTRLDDVDAALVDIKSAVGEKANAADVYTKEEVYTKGEVIAAIADVEHLKRKIVKDIAEAEQFIAANPLTADQYIYMVPAAEGEQTEGDLYDEYMVLENKLERVGDWKVDLSNYATKGELSDLAAEVQGNTEKFADYTTTEALTAALGLKADKTDLEPFATTKAVEDIVALLATKEELQGVSGEISDLASEVVLKETGKSLVSDAEIVKLATVKENAEENFIKSVEATQLKVEEGKLSIIGLDQALIEGLTNKSGAIDTLVNILAEKALKSEVQDLASIVENKVEKNGTDRLITAEEANKLEALVVGEGGKIEISGKVNASNVQELYTAIVNIVTGNGNGVYDGVEKPLLNIEHDAQVNVIEEVQINGVALEVNDKAVNIPIADADILGVVRGSAKENKIAVAADGTMEVNSVNVNKLSQTEGEYLVLNGGTAEI